MQRQLASIPNYSAALNNNNRSRISNPDQWPGRWHPGHGWANLGYYTNYWWNNNAYPLTYYAADGFTPTPYVFYPDLGEFWDAGMGYADSLPYGYDGPISVAVEEVVPVYDAWGHIIDYRTEMFYYNAFWDPNAQAYGFYDYRGAFHWLTFPWLNSWMG